MVVPRILKAKLLPTALIITVLVAVPTAANVYAQTADEKPTTTTKETNNDETPTVTTTKPTPTPDPNVVLVENEEPTPTESPAPSPSPELTAVTLAQAQVIAETEHPASIVVASKTKTINGQKVYKFTFDDGWKVYVRASDGTVVKVQDIAGKDHNCQNEHKKSGVGSEQSSTVSSAVWGQSHKQDSGSSNRSWHRGHND